MDAAGFSVLFYFAPEVGFFKLQERPESHDYQP
jgi:hypothetical protein